MKHLIVYLVLFKTYLWVALMNAVLTPKLAVDMGFSNPNLTHPPGPNRRWVVRKLIPGTIEVKRHALQGETDTRGTLEGRMCQVTLQV